MKRRDFIITAGITGLGVSLMSAAACNPAEGTKEASEGQFQLPDLGYDYKDLEPLIDAQTMEIHHSKHHAGYVKKLNKALKDHPLSGKDLESILSTVKNIPTDQNVINNGGGHFNHSLFWELMQPGGKNTPSQPLVNAIEKQFVSTDKLMSAFSAAAAGVFGSGWAWISLDSNKELFVSSTPNQNNPAMTSLIDRPGIPILGIDVWEHAYYLKYNNRRKEYISNFIKLVNWDIVSQNYEKAMQ